ncbi:hypothetical protein GobsT_28540 [Gemmata obscuriglobus]|uniref:Uncharacterized protein n=1 Tax=Gemmata obscuriglobus TaxID=114 RepID=A0A2Z3H5I2_9BACT|nr:hypothetical protein [Gemmata obscuriglobus]AWM38917.1 hypothetical protein C1280_19275 [Gemmata obscuriglobus]QEG28081.1 hypothetical protein GobsT_28540 [Gemmata obscuriglobus]VTS05692.1 unnamed protein product [Gemmata obscuriglobus UQM 2246]
MKLLLMFVCSVLVGCGVIFGLVNGIVPHLVTPQFFPDAHAATAPEGGSQVAAGEATRTAAEKTRGALVAGSR